MRRENPLTDTTFDTERGESGRATQPCGHHTLVEAECGTALRREMEHFVRTAFARAHGAEVQSFMPTLLGLRGQRRGICGVVGFRLASGERLYLENYLDLPIEGAIAAASGHAARRDEIAEVGNLAGSSCRAAIHLVTALPRFLLARNQRWIVFTATSTVRSMLEHFDAPVFELARAHGECVARTPDAWGRYYDSDPRVMAGFIPDGLLNPAFARALP